jgi:transcriptional regulator with XRE-family HTH domain
MNSKKDIGDYIQKKRKGCGLTQEKLAELVEVSSKTIGAWERGESDIKNENLEKLAKHLNVSVTEIIAAKDMPGLNEEDKQRLDQAIKELNEKVESVHSITIKVENRGFISMRMGVYAFGLSIIALFSALWACSPNTPIFSVICFIMWIIGFVFLLFGNLIIGKLENRTNRESHKE